MKKLTGLFFCFLFALSFPTLSSAEPLQVFVSIPPQGFFLQKIGGDLVRTSIMVPPGANPHNYEPRPSQMADLSRASAYFAVGVAFEEAWLPRFQKLNPKMQIVRTDAGIRKRAMEPAVPLNGSGRHEEPGHHHEAGSPDPHIWLSPPLVLLQARNTLDGLIRIDSGNRERYEANYRRFLAETVDLDLKIMDLFVPTEKGKRFLVMHPSWGYFAHAYGLTQVAIEVEGKEPKPAELAALITMARKGGFKAVFVQPQFSRKIAETIAREIGARVFYADPLAEDWSKNLMQVAQDFKEALK